MATSTVLFRISLALALVGGSLSVFVTWVIGRGGAPGEGPNIGAGFLVVTAGTLVGLAVLLWVAGMITRSVGRSGHGQRMGAVPGQR